MTSKPLSKVAKDAKKWQICQYAEKVTFNEENVQYCRSEQFTNFRYMVYLFR